MSAANPRLLLLFLVAVVLASLVSLGHNAEPAEAKNTVDVNNRIKVITITVNATLVGDVGNASFIKQAFDAYWGKPGYKYRCYKVVMKLDIRTASSPQPGRHTILMTRTNPGDPWVSSVSYPSGDYDPVNDSATGRWGDWDDGIKIAHEFGHILGLPDEYTYKDTDGDGSRDFNEPSVPDPGKAPEYTWTDKPPANGTIDPGEVSLNPGKTPSIMAEWAEGRSDILQRHINSIVDKHAPRGSIECPLAARGTVDETPLKDDYRELRRTAEWEAWGDIDEDGNITGEITITYTAVLTVEDLPAADVGIAGFDPEVGGEITDPNPTRTMALTGTLDGDQLTLDIGTPDDEREPIAFTILGDPGVSTGFIDAPAADAVVIEIDMVPFSPFAGPATVEDGPDGTLVVDFFEEGADYTIEWTAELSDPTDEPVS